MKFINCNLLHWSYEKHAVPVVPEHIHSYYQIELCVQGTIKFTSGKKQLQLHAGEWMLIPPETLHGMIYEGKDLEYYSFKFAVNGLDIAPERKLHFQASDPLSLWVIDSLVSQRPPNRYLYMPINENRMVLEALLQSMLQHALAPVDGKSPQPELLRSIADLIASEGAMINIQRAAEKLDLNVSQLKYRYKNLCNEYDFPEKDLTLKEFIDHELIKQIDRFLLYSTLSLGEIARQTKFNNIYTFSRFVKRMTGENPSKRRINCRKKYRKN